MAEKIPEVCSGLQCREVYQRDIGYSLARSNTLLRPCERQPGNIVRGASEHETLLKLFELSG